MSTGHGAVGDARKRITATVPPERAHCQFPDCTDQPTTDYDMCVLHARVHVTGSWVASAKHEDDQ